MVELAFVVAVLENRVADGVINDELELLEVDVASIEDIVTGDVPADDLDEG